jgi:hypothetical protein
VLATKVNGLSASVTVNLPESVRVESVSVRLDVAVLMTAASFVPRISMAMVLVVPSLAMTVKVSA